MTAAPVTTTEPLPVEERWTYADVGGLTHPVQLGQVWKVGPHVAACLDYMTDTSHRDIVNGLVTQFPPTLLYADPPWDNGRISQFRTKAGLLKDTSNMWEALFRAIVAFVPHKGKGSIPVFLEAGKRQKMHLLTEVLHHHENVTVYDATYGGSAPCLVVYAGPVPSKVDLTAVDVTRSPAVVFEAYATPDKPGRVLDPYANKGQVVIAAAKRGWATTSVELSRYRVSATLVALTAISGEVPERIA